MQIWMDQNPREYSDQQHLLRLQINLNVSGFGSNKDRLIVRNLLAPSQMERILHGIGDYICWHYPCLVPPILPQISLCKKKILRHIKMSANAWSTKC
jgi:hypothetical protein